MEVKTLIDTGCGTSLVTSELLDSVGDRYGAVSPTSRARADWAGFGHWRKALGGEYGHGHLHTGRHANHASCVRDASFAVPDDFGHGFHSYQESFSLIHP